MKLMRSCSSGKRRFLDQESALACMEHYKENGYNLKAVYRCTECGAWHHTSREARRTKRSMLWKGYDKFEFPD